MCGLGGLAGDLSLTASCFFASRTLDPDTEVLADRDLLLRRPRSFFSRCSRLFFFLSRRRELGEELDLSLFLLLRLFSFLALLGSSGSTATSTSLDGKAFLSLDGVAFSFPGRSPGAPGSR